MTHAANTIIKIFDSEYSDIATCTDFTIEYINPLGVSGVWTGTNVNTTQVSTTHAYNTLIAGVYKCQIVAYKGTEKFYSGDVVLWEITENLIKR